MIIAQITDLHVVAGGQKMAGMLDTNGMARAAITQLNALTPQPDVVLVTGDLVDDGEPSAYAMLRELLDGLTAPYYVIPGNHDRRAPLLQAMAGHAQTTPSGFIQYVIDDFAVRLVALDTLIEGHDDGLLCTDRLAWLEAELQREPTRATLVFMHHPPFETGVWWMDASGLSGAAAFREVIARHPQVARVVCGHIHRPIQTNWGATPVSVGPSTAYQVYLDLVPESPPRAILEPPAYQLHVFDGRQSVTHTGYVNCPQAPIDLCAFLGDWNTLKITMRQRKAALR